jgi:hypothetical protein
MDYGMIGKIEKAKRYAEERERVTFQEFRATLMGANNPHQIQYLDGEWVCDCDFFIGREYCSHTMAFEQILQGMLPTKVDEM